MQCITHVLHPKGEGVEIVPLADLHVGDRQSQPDLIKKLIDGIRETEDRYCILGGDLMNTAIAGGKSGKSDAMTLWVKISHDKFELPEAVAETVPELAQMLHINPVTIYSTITRHKKGKAPWCGYVKVEVEDDTDI